jgi:hypothetical protein
MAVELTQKLPAQDFAVPSHGNICQKNRSDSLEKNGIPNLAAAVIPPNSARECQLPTHIRLRKSPSESQELAGLRASNLQVALGDVSAKSRKNLQVCFSHLRSGDAERYPHSQKRNSLLAAKIGGYQISINAKEEKLTM